MVLFQAHGGTQKKSGFAGYRRLAGVCTKGS